MSERSTAAAAVVLARGELAALCTFTLRHCDLETATTETPGGARQLLRRETSVIVVDTTIPGADELIASISGGPTPIVALVDLDAGGSSYRSFAAGADQVVRLPFTPDELAVRAVALLRRLGRPVRFTHAQAFDGLELSLDEQVHIGSRTVRLSPTLNSLLYVLAANADHVVSHGALHRLVWGLERALDDEPADAALRQLGSALDDHSGWHYVVELQENGARLAPSSSTRP